MFRGPGPSPLYASKPLWYQPIMFSMMAFVILPLVRSSLSFSFLRLIYTLIIPGIWGGCQVFWEEHGHAAQCQNRLSLHWTGGLRVLKKGAIITAPSTQIMSMSMISLDMMIRILNGEEAGKALPFFGNAFGFDYQKENVNHFNHEKLFGERSFGTVLKNDRILRK